MSPSKSQVTKWKQDFISLNLAKVLGGRERVDSEEKLKKQGEGGQAAIALAQNAVIKFPTKEEFLVQRLSVQNVKLT